MALPTAYLGDLIDRECLATALVQARQITTALYADLTAEDLRFPYRLTLNPGLWELAHIGWFQEHWCVRSETAAPSIFRKADEWFDSRVVPHTDRWTFPYPEKSVIEDYMAQTLTLTLARLATRAPGDSLYAYQLALGHEYMHQEAMRMTLADLGLATPAMATLPTQPNGTIAIPGGTIELGYPRPEDLGPRFVFDNEIGSRSVTVKPFVVSSQLVAMANAANAPARLHVSYAEAAAYAAHLGGRLPTEAEWRVAYRESSAFAASTGLAWEWTADPFTPFAGFKPGPYAEYSQPWFHTHRVLKGGSLWTHAALKYPEYRNFYQDHRRDVATGIRVVFDHS
jgi:gamma-glutamyl hercynylcysteine S-oxide synthase